MGFNKKWDAISQKVAIYEDPTNLGIVSGLVKDPSTGAYIVAFARRGQGQSEVIGPLYALLFDASWQLMASKTFLDGDYQRPHIVLVNDALYVGYDEKILVIGRISLNSQ